MPSPPPQTRLAAHAPPSSREGRLRKARQDRRRRLVRVRLNRNQWPQRRPARGAHEELWRCRRRPAGGGDDERVSELSQRVPENPVQRLLVRDSESVAGIRRRRPERPDVTRIYRSGAAYDSDELSQERANERRESEWERLIWQLRIDSDGTTRMGREVAFQHSTSRSERGGGLRERERWSARDTESMCVREGDN
jgi:hypothetical protein